jgi:hypothetical protein
MKNDEIETLNLAGWPMPDSYLVEIGRISALWAALEVFLNMCIGKLAGFDELNDPKPSILIYHSSFPQKLDMLGSLCEHLLPTFPTLSEYGSVISKLRAAQKARNTYVHNSMVEDPDTGKMMMPTGSFRGKVDATVRPVGLPDIRRASVAIDDAQRALYKLVLRRDLPSLTDRRKKI